MGLLITGILGAVAITIGLAIVMTNRDTAERMTDRSKVFPGDFTPGAVGCGGIAIMIVGVLMVIVAIVVALTQ